MRNTKSTNKTVPTSRPPIKEKPSAVENRGSHHSHDLTHGNNGGNPDEAMHCMLEVLEPHLARVRNHVHVENLRAGHTNFNYLGLINLLKLFDVKLKLNQSLGLVQVVRDG